MEIVADVPVWVTLRNVTDEISLVRRGQIHLAIVARFENLDFAPQHYRQREIALARLVNNIAALQNLAVPKWLQLPELPVIQLGKRDALGVPVKLLVVTWFQHSTPSTHSRRLGKGESSTLN